MGGNGLTGANTRLDGLVALLESGSNASIRKMAATQIGDLVAAHPSEIRPVLRRVRRLLRSTAWEARVASGEALAAIANQSPHFNPEHSAASNQKQEDQTLKSEPHPVQTTEANPSESHSTTLNCALRFDTFDLDKLMSDGAMLFGSSGDEYNVGQADVAAQRARLKADLGLDDKFSTGGDVLGLRDEDLTSQQTYQTSSDMSTNGSNASLATADFVAEMSGNISARERNRLKRIAKRKAKQDADGLPKKRPRGADLSGDAEAGRSQGEVFSLSELGSASNDEDAEIESKLDSSYWDFQATCEVLKEHLLLPRWEWRHGAAVGLRQILMRHAQSAGRKSVAPIGDEENENWLEDMCCRLLCVLAMDRFNDFVGDAVVAPVREAAAMTIGAAAKVMSPRKTIALMERLLYLLKTSSSKQWEVRHASLLGVRYVLAVKDEMAKELIEMAFDPIADGLQDPDDDVRSVAAEALLPVVFNVIKYMSVRVTRLVSNLWEALLDLDDICASTSSVMKLLSEISSHPVPQGVNPLWLDLNLSGDESDLEDNKSDPNKVDGNVTSELVELVPRLWPFFRHSSKSVRRASINLLETVSIQFGENEFLQWLVPVASDFFTRLYRNILLETETDILDVSKRIWEKSLQAFGKRRQLSRELVQTFGPLLKIWIEIASQETRVEAAMRAQNSSKANTAAARRKAAAARRAAKARKAKAVGVVPQGYYGVDSDSAPAVEGPYDGAVMQKNAAVALGFLAVFWPNEDSTCESELMSALESSSGIAKRISCDILQQWAERSHYEAFIFSERVKTALDKEVFSEGNFPFAEVGASVGSFFTDTISFLDNMPVNLDGIGLDVMSLKSTALEGKKANSSRDTMMAAACAQSLKSMIHQLVTGDTWEYLNRSLQGLRLQKRVVDGIASLRLRLLASLGYMDVRQETIRVSLCASATAAIVSAVGSPLPQKVGPLIRSLTAAIRSMVNPHLQLQAAVAISKLAYRLVSRSPKPVTLMMKNLMKYLTCVQGVDDKIVMASLQPGSTIKLEAEPLAKRGGMLSMKQFCLTFKETLFSALPYIWARISEPLSNSTNLNSANQDTRDAMIILRAIVAHLDSRLHGKTASLFPFIVSVCAVSHDGYMKEAPQCLADTVCAIPGPGMQAVVMNLIPLLDGSQIDKQGAVFARRGAARALRAVVERMGTKLIPYAAFMVVPMMTRMVDEDEIVRDSAAGVFGTLIRLMPLEGGVPDDPSMSEAMATERQSARSFLGQLLGSEPRKHYELPMSIGDGIVLRKYQQECLDWLAFLNKYGLHGALCDDMGLGKTLMTLCMITGSYVNCSNEGRALPSLVVCPSTIVAHWVMEAQRFFGHALGNIVQYSGVPKIRMRIRSSERLESSALIVTSYEVLSNDLRHFEHIRWNYLVLDEGHVIKNSKTRVAKAVRSVSANNRLILTGTPIQNSVLELWAMFDFLMPGFLGTEKMFKDTYAKPIMASRDAKCTEADHEKGLVATEALHRQVLPFILRRLKDDVLAELPPKIMQDYYCHMTPLQMRLYEDFATDVSKGGAMAPTGRGGDGDGDEEMGGAKSSGGSHAFRALSYLRRLCSHPKLVLNPKHPEFASVQQMLHEQRKSIDDITSSAKLVGLMNILHECGIGISSNNNSSGASSNSSYNGSNTANSLASVNMKNTGGHRALIFAQLKQMLDLVESDLFRVHMPGVTYLRLDGSVEASKRQPIVTRFNADPTIDCLLLTTHVGGLGLNLTGADTVIFLEHDWNPTKDLQAMDRAHRMGQKRTVNVYRLITRGTLEEKIMNIQQFKTHVANAVVNRENSTLQSMNTEQMLDLFKVDKASAVDGDDDRDATIATSVAGGKGMKAALAGLGDLWEETQYEDEYNMNSFLAGIK